MGCSAKFKGERSKAAVAAWSLVTILSLKADQQSLHHFRIVNCGDCHFNSSTFLVADKSQRIVIQVSETSRKRYSKASWLPNSCSSRP